MTTGRTEPTPLSLAAVPRNASIYWLDADDRIVRVNRAWREFAEANGAPTLAARAIGHQLWEFVSDPHLRQLLRELFDHARHSAQPLRVVYRCDAPAIVRTYALHLLPTSDGGLECASELLAESRRSPVALLETEEEEARGGQHLLLCSWCKRAHVGEWVDLESAVRLLGLLHEDPVPPITHGLCEDCDRRLRDELEA